MKRFMIFVTILLFLPFKVANASPITKVISTTSQIDVTVSQGKIVRLPAPAAGVFIADPAIADVQAQSDQMVYIFGKKAGSTSLFAVQPDDTIVAEYRVVIRHDTVLLNKMMSDILDGSITAKSVPNGIILAGQAESSSDIEDARQLAARFLGEEEIVINRIALENPTQVNLHVRVAEVSRSVGKIFGINWESLFRPGDFVFGLANGRSFPETGFTRFVDQEGTAGAIFGGYEGNNISIDGIVDALEREGFVTVLAQPNLTAVSGETASFLAGGEFPVPVGVDDGTIQIEFKEFGVSLDFTPTVMNNDRISLKVRPEVSELSDNGAITINNIEIPALSTRRAETTVELGHGQSFAIGGLVSTNTRNEIDKMPGLGDIPVLGTLFRSSDFLQNESELVIIITPYLVEPLAESQLATPLDGFRPPTDIERILHGQLFAAKEETDHQKSLSDLVLYGDAGFILD